MAKAKFNPKDFLMRKGEWLALGVAGIGLAVLLLLGMMEGLGADNPKTEADFFTGKSAAIQNQIQKGTQDPEALPPWINGLQDDKPIPKQYLVEKSILFDPIETPNTKRENPKVLNIGDYQVDLIRAAMKGFDKIYDNTGQVISIGMIITKKTDQADLEKMKEALNPFKDNKRRGHRAAPVTDPMPEPGDPKAGGAGGGRKPRVAPIGAGAIVAGAKREEKAVQYVPFDDFDKAIAEGKVPATTIIPLRMIVIHAEFPLKKQQEEIKRALRLASLADAAKIGPRFDGFDVQRRVTRVLPDGQIQVVQDWPADLETTYDYLSKFVDLIRFRKAEDHFDEGYLPYFLRYEEAMALPLPELVAEMGESGLYPPIMLPNYLDIVKKLKNANQPPQKASDLHDRLQNAPQGKDAFMPETGAQTGAGALGITRPPLVLRPKKEDPKNLPPVAPIEPEHLLIRFIDADVAPGFTYEYRMRVRMENPNFGMTNEVANPVFATEAYKILKGDWTIIRGSITLPTETFVFAYDPGTYKKQIQEAHKDAKDPLYQLLQLKDHQAVIQFQEWKEQIRTDSGKTTREPVGAWVVAEMPVGRGEFLGKKQYVKLPLWSAENAAYVLRQTQADSIIPPKNGKSREQPKGWLVDFHTRDILVDFEGGVTKTRVGNKTIDEDASAEMLIRLDDGTLIVRSTIADAEDSERKKRSELWESWVKLVEQRRGSAAPSGPGNEFDRKQPSGP